MADKTMKGKILDAQYLNAKNKISITVGKIQLDEDDILGMVKSHGQDLTRWLGQEFPVISLSAHHREIERINKLAREREQQIRDAADELLERQRGTGQPINNKGNTNMAKNQYNDPHYGLSVSTGATGNLGHSLNKLAAQLYAPAKATAPVAPVAPADEWEVLQMTGTDAPVTNQSTEFDAEVFAANHRSMADCTILEMPTNAAQCSCGGKHGAPAKAPVPVANAEEWVILPMPKAF